MCSGQYSNGSGIRLEQRVFADYSGFDALLAHFRKCDSKFLERLHAENMQFHLHSLGSLLYCLEVGVGGRIRVFCTR